MITEHKITNGRNVKLIFVTLPLIESSASQAPQNPGSKG